MVQQPRLRRRILPVLVILLIVIFTFRRRDFVPSTVDHGQFWSSFHDLLNGAAPDCQKPKRLEDHPTAIGFKPDQVENITLPEHIVVKPGDIETLKKAHTKFMGLISSWRAPRPVYTPGTRGIVSTAGGRYLPVMVNSLHMLRRTGSTLPVELFVADMSEYDEFVCGTLFPSLNARCVILSDILESSPLAEGLKKYQFKIFALLFSSFEEVLFLDADAFPIHDPMRLFVSEPFASTGMITWPDFWQVSYHPSFFQVTSQQLPTTFPHASTESGQVLVSKRSHGKMLLLSTYYNFYGPSNYYPLLSQGHPGEGDKETFVPAAMLLKLPYYAVSTGPGVLGYKTPSGGWEGGVIMQADPNWDSKLPKGESYGWGGKPNPPSNTYITCHANLPKLDPISVFGGRGLAWNPEGKPQRLWGSAKEVSERVGSDLEKELWSALNITACEMEGKFHPWDKEPKLCETIGKFIEEMSKS